MSAVERAEALGWSVVPGRYNLAGEIIQSEIKSANKKAIKEAEQQRRTARPVWK